MNLNITADVILMQVNEINQLRQDIVILTSSRDRWKELALAEMEDIGSESCHIRREKAIAALKVAGEWEREGQPEEDVDA